MFLLCFCSLNIYSVKHCTEGTVIICFSSVDFRRTENIQALIGLKSDHYTAVIIEDEESYIGREVCAISTCQFFLPSHDEIELQL